MLDRHPGCFEAPADSLPEILIEPKAFVKLLIRYALGGLEQLLGFAQLLFYLVGQFQVLAGQVFITLV